MIPDKPVRFAVHALERLDSRGTNRAEVENAIRTVEWVKAESNRWECRMDVDFDATWNGKHYKTKQVRPIFVEEAAEIVVVTVYTYFF